MSTTGTLLPVAAVFAVGDWLAVHYRFFRVEYVLKPATLVALVVAAAGADLGDAKPWVVTALVFGLLGDVGLMLSSGRTDRPFLAGLAAFLIGHLFYQVAFVVAGVHALESLAGLLIVGGAAGLALPEVLRGARQRAGLEFSYIVGAYAAVLAVMAVLAVGTSHIATAVGGVLFLVSDTLIARDRFVAPVRHGKLLVIVTYHLTQFLILIGLIGSF
ncbi:MAG: lysoplasmalogenase [Jatrophihabitans sp.]|uniref:lysoplasmalogenase n=1 Tax=Jatrophihabitans sp. TaxID=1932789 RepID=UPI00390ECB3A